MEEPQSSWLAFQRGELDILNLPSTFAPAALPHGKLAPDLASKGVYLSRILLPAINYTAFNLRDPVLGGFTNDKLALRRAIAMAYDIDAEVDVIRKSQAEPLSMRDRLQGAPGAARRLDLRRHRRDAALGL